MMYEWAKVSEFWPCCVVAPPVQPVVGTRLFHELSSFALAIQVFTNEREPDMKGETETNPAPRDY